MRRPRVTPRRVQNAGFDNRYSQGATGTVRGPSVTADLPNTDWRMVVTFRNRSVLTREEGTYLMSAVSAGTDTLRARVWDTSPSLRLITVAIGPTVFADTL